MRTLAHSFTTSPIFTESAPPELQKLISLLPYGSLSVRKFIVGACRLQSPIFVNKHLITEFNAIPPLERTIVDPIKEISISEDELVIAINTAISSMVWVSILAYFARVERPYYQSEFLEQKRIGSIKELKAAVGEDRSQQLNYTALFTFDPTVRISGFCPVDHNQLVQMWGIGLAKLPSYFMDKVVYPHYNTHKNISHASSGFYAQATGGEDNRTDVTTWDLLEYYFRTGEKIQGPMEFRVGWKLNDLKPRAYYCTGGTGYFKSQYIKPICNVLQDILPCTNVYTRFDTSRLSIDFISMDEFLITYDYSCFTSSLAELKYFLAHLGNYLKGSTMRILDVHDGLMEIDIGEYLLEYNESINIGMEISTHRVVDDDVEMADPTDSTIFMTRNGPLGIGGNIGFSTALHGISLAAFTDRPDRDSCVGDDALTRLLKTLFGPFVLHTNLLGDINASKFATLERDFYAMDISHIEGFRYLKRPLKLDYFGKIETGTLLIFPGLAEILSLTSPDSVRDVVDKPQDIVAKSFATQTGRYLSHLERFEGTTIPERQGLLSLLRRAYHMVGLPIEGCLPSIRVFSRGPARASLINFVVPPLDEDIFEYGWEFVLCRESINQRITSELRSESKTFDRFHGKGSSFRGTSSPALEILVNLDLVRRDSIIIERIVGEDFWAEDLINLLLTDSYVVFDFTQIAEEIPAWYDEIVDLDYYHPLHNY